MSKFTIGCLALLTSTLLMSGMAGCGRRRPDKADPTQAQSALIAALDAWQKNQPAERLRERAPAIDFRDTEWEKGSKLTRYEIQKMEPWGLSAKFTVKLFLRRDGTKRERVVLYNVDTDPTIVIRAEF